jgi:hypothetical protein
MVERPPGPFSQSFPYAFFDSCLVRWISTREILVSFQHKPFLNSPRIDRKTGKYLRFDFEGGETIIVESNDCIVLGSLAFKFGNP